MGHKETLTNTTQELNAAKQLVKQLLTRRNEEIRAAGRGEGDQISDPIIGSWTGLSGPQVRRIRRGQTSDD